VDAVEVDLRAQDARPFHIAGDRGVDRRAVDGVRVDDFPVLLHAGHESEVRRLRRRLLLLLLP